MACPVKGFFPHLSTEVERAYNFLTPCGIRVLEPTLLAVEGM